MVEYKKVKLSRLFTLESISGVNKNKLDTSRNDYDYVTRTSENNGVESTTGKIKGVALNEANTISLGLLQMTFYYRNRPWYAGQFVKKLIPKFSLNEKRAIYFIVILNKFRNKLLSVLVRDVETVFNSLYIDLPIDSIGNINYRFMEEQITELENDRMTVLEKYLSSTGLSSYKLTENDKQILALKPEQKKFSINDIFSTPGKGDTDLQQDDIDNKGEYFINSGETNWGVKGKTDKKAKVFPKNTITIDFFGNAYYRDFSYKLATHNHVFSFDDPIIKNKEVGLYLVSALQFLKKEYSYSNMLTWEKLRRDSIFLPVVPGTNEIDFSYMERYIQALQKVAIKSVIKYKNLMKDNC